MKNHNEKGCNCSFPPSDVTRRRFLQSTMIGSAAALATRPLTALAESPQPVNPISETLVSTLYQSMSEEQRGKVCFEFDHPLRSRVDNNWNITEQHIADFFTPDQQALIREIFIKLHSREYADTVLKQVEHDSGKAGFGSCSVALFGKPGTGKFEFVLTGRHCTRRCDGDSVEGTAFGGPIFYGHAAESFKEKPHHPGNAYWYQAVRANAAFQMLDGRQRKMALLGSAREEDGNETVRLTGKTEGLPGIPISEFTPDQKAEVRKIMNDLLAPFRPQDAKEAMKLVEQAGFDHLHMAFFQNHDLGKDGIWDVWQLEGPSMVWFFRGAPHVHAWINIREKA